MSYESDAQPELPTEIVELATSDEVAHVLFGRFTSSLDFYDSKAGHQVAGTQHYKDNATSNIRRYIDGEFIFEKAFSDKSGLEFQGHIILWGDGIKKVVTLTYLDRKRDIRGASHTDYHVVGDPSVVMPAAGLLEQNPQEMVALYHQIFPGADRSEGTLTVVDLLDIGDIAKPNEVEQPIEPSRQRRAGLLGRLGLR